MLLAATVVTALLLARVPAVGAQQAECSPGPGEIANFFVHVQSITAGGFVGPASTTLHQPTGEVVTVHANPSTQWHGAVQGLGDVQPGMDVQAVGPRQDDCSIIAVNIFTPEAPTQVPPDVGSLPQAGTGSADRPADLWQAAALATLGVGALMLLAGLAAHRLRRRPDRP